jgi:hypothetical protein
LEKTLEAEIGVLEEPVQVVQKTMKFRMPVEISQG